MFHVIYLGKNKSKAFTKNVKDGKVSNTWNT